MTSIVDISPASEEDLTILAHIAPQALAVDLLYRIKYESNDPFDTTQQECFILAELRRASLNPEAHIFKATEKSTKKILGYGLLRYYHGEDPPQSSTTPFPPGSNADAIWKIAKDFKENHFKYMDGRRHVGWCYYSSIPPLCR